MELVYSETIGTHPRRRRLDLLTEVELSIVRVTDEI